MAMSAPGPKRESRSAQHESAPFRAARVPVPARWRPSPLIAASFAVHALALAALVVAPHAWRSIVGVLLANHLVLTALGLWPRSRALGPNWTRLPAAAAARKAIAITIDDGPDPEVTPRVLELLAREGVRATFFCIGEKVDRHPELCRAIVAGGHAIENHTARHPPGFALLGVGGMTREAAGAQASIARATGTMPLFFRAPAGLRSPLLQPALCRVGLQLASWTRRGFDTRERDADEVLGRLLRNLGAGDILLLHDGNAARTADGTPVILAVLPRVIAAIRAAGLEPVTLRTAL
jgi:peptidoglycan/xylan/chitin deacetylase (PgdA/CDA1 family)